MIQVENLSYGFPTKDLYKDISFTLEAGQHAAFIGSNGTGKTTLINLLLHPDDYLYDGKITKDDCLRIGYVNQFSAHSKAESCTVYEYLNQDYVLNQENTAKVCEDMATAEDVEPLFEIYQRLLDEYEAMDGDNFESNIRKELYVAGMRELEKQPIELLSGGEYKLLQVMKEMLLQPNLLIMDEPDAFLDFHNLNRLINLINGFKGTLLVITHNRFLLNKCFNKILHLENADLQEFDGTYPEYRCALLRHKLEVQTQANKDMEEIERTEKMVASMRARATAIANASLGRAVHAKQTQLDRLRARQIKTPFIELREPNIVLPTIDDASIDAPENTSNEEQTSDVVLKLTNYQADFDDSLLEPVDFELLEGEKVAVIGANGTGKTTLIRDIMKQESNSIWINPEANVVFLSQLQGETLEQDKTVAQIFECNGIENKKQMLDILNDYCLDEALLSQRVEQLSGGEQNLLQIAIIGLQNAKLLVLDEPTSHLDIYAQAALEKALTAYKGAVFMVTHDYYLINACADYVLYVEDKQLRRMRNRTFRKMVYETYFDQKYLENDQKKQELEMRISKAFQSNDLITAEKLCDELEAISS